MKYIIVVLFFFIIIFSINAQNVGINNSDPQVSLDIAGGFALRSEILVPYLNILNLPENVSYIVINNTDVTGPVTVIDPNLFINGRRLVIYNNSGFDLTFASYTMANGTIDEFIISLTGWRPFQSSDSQLEKITEGANTGWRLLGKNPALYGNIGEHAIDLSYSYFPSTTFGATGEGSTAVGFSTTASDIASLATGFGTVASGYTSTSMGLNTRASGYLSTAMGNSSTAKGSMTTSMGKFTIARSYGSVAIGRYNDTIADSDQLVWIDTDPLLILGNGTAADDRQNAMVVYKNGDTDLNGFTRLGKVEENAPKVKIKKITIPSGPVVDSSENYPFGGGITDSKILGISVLMNHDAPTGTSKIPPGYQGAIGYEYNIEIALNGVHIINKMGNSLNIGAKPITILITYEE